MSRLNRLRFLPITIFAAALLLTIKVGDIWQGVDGLLHPAVTIAAARAQQTPPAAPVAAAPTSPQGEAAAAPPPAPMPTDPTVLTYSEIELLQQLAERREELENREMEIDQKEALLTAAEARIERRVEELRDLKAIVDDLIQRYDAQQEAKTQSLVKIYENMKPKDAARIFEELDMDTLLMVAERMKERKLAPVMAKMNPAKAREVTVELARMRNLPGAEVAEGG